MNGFTRVRALGATLAFAAVAAVGVSPAYAEAAPDDTQFSVTAGALAFGASPGAPNVPTLPGLTLNGQAQTLNATMSNWSVADATGSGSGWRVTTQGDSGSGKSAVFKEYCTSILDCGSVGYVSGGQVLAANSLTLSSTGAAFSAQNGTTGTAPTHSCASACNVDSATAVTIGSAAVNAGMGTYQANSYSSSSLALSAPTTIKALGTGKVYRVDLTWTLASGPS
jgi:hypothetical protein